MIIAVTPDALRSYAARVQAEGSDLVTLAARLPEVTGTQASQLAVADAHAHVTATVAAMNATLTEMAAKLRFSAQSFESTDATNAADIEAIL